MDYEYTVELTSTQTTKLSEHRLFLFSDVKRMSEDGWELVSTDSLIRGPFTETLTYWKRELAEGISQQEREARNEAQV